MVTFILCSESANISHRELEEMCRPLEENAKHAAVIWDVPAPAVDVVIDPKQLQQLPRRGRHYAPIVFLDDDWPESEPPELAAHYHDPVVLFPPARVLVHRTSNFHTGEFSIFGMTAHVLLEGLINPDLNIWNPHPDPSRAVDIPREITDPLQNSYPIAHNGTTWPAANFVTPEWYLSVFFNDAQLRKDLFSIGHGFDYLKSLRMPGEIGFDGYTILRDRVTGAISSEARIPSQSWLPRSAIERRAKLHPWSRSHRLGLKV